MKEMEPKHAAKRKMLGELSKMMRKMSGDKAMGGMSVQVAAKDKEGLKEGLKKAEEVIESPEKALEGAEVLSEESEEKEEGCSECGMRECECEESEPSDELSMLSKEELIAKIKELSK